MRSLGLFLLLSAGLPVAMAQSPSSADSAQSKAETVRYHATIDNVKYVFGVATPVARLRPGNILGSADPCLFEGEPSWP